MDYNLIELTPSASSHTQSGPGDADIYVPEKVCAKMIRYVVEDHKLAYVDFTGGCDGNLKAISALVAGMDVDQVVEKLSGITCGKKSTSCADQLCKALRAHMGD